MKRTKPLDPREADRLSKAILAANELDSLDSKHQLMVWEIIHTEQAKALPHLSWDALLAFLNGDDASESAVLANLPGYEFAQFRANDKFHKVRKVGLRVKNLRKAAQS